MKQIMLSTFILAGIFFVGCNSGESEQSATSETTAAVAETGVGQSGVKDEVSKPNVVQVAASSKDHTTLVTAVKAAGLVDALSNAGPFTVFAPVNAAFDKLPAGTVEGLLKPEKKSELEDILGYHTYVGVLDGVLLQDGAEYDMVFGGKVKITKEGDKTLVNGNPILATIKAANGVVHVIDVVLLPK